MEQKIYNVFISYCRTETDIALLIAQKLKESGLESFLDLKNIQDNSSYIKQVQSAIMSSKYFIYVYGNNSENSIFQRRELDLALTFGKKVFAIFMKIDNTGTVYSILKTNAICYSNINIFIKEINNRFEIIDNAVSLQKINISEHLQTSARPSMCSAPPEDTKKCKDNLWTRFNKAIKTRLFLVWSITLTTILGCIVLLSQVHPAHPDISFKGAHPDISFRGADTDLVNAVSSNYKIWIGLILGFGLGFTLETTVKYLRKRNKNVKISSDTDAVISIDNEPKSEIHAGEVYSTHLSRGEYLIDFKPKKSNQEGIRLIQKITSSEPRVILGDFSRKHTINFKCFIAGSIALDAERDALIVKSSEIHNKWEHSNILISSYTFKDFARHAVVGGQQRLYDNFIKQEANWAIFILHDGIGEKTLNEYQVAMNSFIKEGHPKILFLTYQNSTMDSNVLKIKREIQKANLYWNTCINIQDMKSLFRECIEWDIELLDKKRMRRYSIY